MQELCKISVRRHIMLCTHLKALSCETRDPPKYRQDPVFHSAEACLSCKAGMNSPTARDKMTNDASSAEATQYFGAMSVIHIHT